MDTLKVTVMVCVSVTDVPVIAMLYVLREVPATTVTVSVDALVAGLGLKLLVLEDGCPADERLTCPWKPLLGVIVTV